MVLPTHPNIATEPKIELPGSASFILNRLSKLSVRGRELWDEVSDLLVTIRCRRSLSCFRFTISFWKDDSHKVSNNSASQVTIEARSQRKTHPHFDDSIFEGFELMRRTESFEPNVRQDKVLFPELFLELVNNIWARFLPVFPEEQSTFIVQQIKCPLVEQQKQTFWDGNRVLLQFSSAAALQIVLNP